jgi:isopentenyl phosphate kinase
MTTPPQSARLIDPKLAFIKLGGSLITDKMSPGIVRQEVLDSICTEIRDYIDRHPDQNYIIGHGSGSFGHVPAERYRTREGVTSRDDWRGFSEVWREAARLNHLVLKTMFSLDVPVIAFPPSAAVTTSNREIVSWNLDPIRQALNAHQVPLTYGDVVVDLEIGGTILSTEDIFVYLAQNFLPSQILLAGVEDGVWGDRSGRTGLIPQVTPQNLSRILPSLGGAAGHDVTGGMADKVAQMARLVQEIPGLEVVIFSGMEPGNLTSALSRLPIGTRISGNKVENHN